MTCKPKTASVSHCPAYGTRLGRLLFSQRDHGHYHLQTLPLPGLNSHLIHLGVFWRFIKSWLIVIVWVLNIHQLGLQKHHCYVNFCSISNVLCNSRHYWQWKRRADLEINFDSLQRWFHCEFFTSSVFYVWFSFGCFVLFGFWLVDGIVLV